jgi:hypothetical protein
MATSTEPKLGKLRNTDKIKRIQGSWRCCKTIILNTNIIGYANILYYKDIKTEWRYTNFIYYLVLVWKRIGKCDNPRKRELLSGVTLVYRSCLSL